MPPANTTTASNFEVEVGENGGYHPSNTARTVLPGIGVARSNVKIVEDKSSTRIHRNRRGE
jgi:hypothetical protein